MEAIRKHQTETLGQEATATITRGGARSVGGGTQEVDRTHVETDGGKSMVQLPH